MYLADGRGEQVVIRREEAQPHPPFDAVKSMAMLKLSSNPALRYSAGRDGQRTGCLAKSSLAMYCVQTLEANVPTKEGTCSTAQWETTSVPEFL